MAAAVKEVKENKMPLATAAKKFDVPRNTLRS
jgi:transposase-like protein